MISNFHTHTYRCHHAYGSDEEYVQCAIRAGIKQLGFSDHTPWHYHSHFQPTMRMNENQLDEYIESISTLKNKYKNQIDILIGLECEYFEKYIPWLKKTIKEKNIDYIILGNHYYQSDETHIYFGTPVTRKLFQSYIEQCLKAIDTGLYSYIAHPDLVYYDEDPQFYRQEMIKLCQYAKKHDVPLEFNLLGFVSGRHYPAQKFWEIASENGNKVIIGFDAHTPESLLAHQAYQQAKDYLQQLNLEIVETVKTLK